MKQLPPPACKTNDISQELKPQFSVIVSSHCNTSQLNLCHVKLCHFTSCHVKSSHATSSCHVMPRQLASSHVTSHHVKSSHVNVISVELQFCDLQASGIFTTYPMIPFIFVSCVHLCPISFPISSVSEAHSICTQNTQNTVYSKFHLNTKHSPFNFMNTQKHIPYVFGAFAITGDSTAR